MRTTRWPALFVCGVVWIGVCAGPGRAAAQESGEAGDKARILAQEQAWFDANARADTRTLDEIFDSALVYVEDGRLETKGDYLARIRQAGSHRRHVAAEAMTVEVYGDTAIVVGTYREISVKDGQAQKRWRFIDTWVSKNGSWILVAAGASPVAR
jgi:ketosteroid isomerase-like protein